MLLDLRLPRKNGREVLREIKTDANLRAIPVVVLAASEAEEDILRSYEMGANAFVTKPVDFARFIEVVRLIDNFFVAVVRRPPRLTPARRSRSPTRDDAGGAPVLVVAADGVR